MLVLLLILGAAVCTGYEYENHSTENYGNTLRIRLSWRAHSLMFFHDDNSEGTVLWNHSDSADTMRRRGTKIGSYYVIDKVTQQDSGRYEIRDKGNNLLSKTSINIKVNVETIEVAAHEKFNFNFNLEKGSCNIKFVPFSPNDGFDIVREGKLQRRSDESFCEGLQYVSPCKILHEEVTKSCDGHFEVNDDYGNRAWQLRLDVRPPSFDATPIIISVVVLCAIIFCCCCVRRCCCKKSSKKDQKPDNEPVLLRRTDFGEPSETPYSAQPNATTGPLIHNPPTVNVPSAYSQVSAPAEPRHAPTVPVSFTPTVPPPYAPTVPASCAASEFEPRFELKNFSSCSPLSSDSTEVIVYNSDKLNFP